MKKLLLFVVIFLFTPILNAAEAESGMDEYKTIRNNICCHYCRISCKRNRSTGTVYIACTTCKFSYCTLCLKKKLEIKSDALIFLLESPQFECPACTVSCCCKFDDCKINHEHCFTYKRTVKRHFGKIYKWKKKKAKVRKEYQKADYETKVKDENFPPSYKRVRAHSDLNNNNLPRKKRKKTQVIQECKHEINIENLALSQEQEELRELEKSIAEFMAELLEVNQKI